MLTNKIITNIVTRLRQERYFEYDGEVILMTVIILTVASALLPKSFLRP